MCDVLWTVVVCYAGVVKFNNVISLDEPTPMLRYISRSLKGSLLYGELLPRGVNKVCYAKLAKPLARFFAAPFLSLISAFT